MWFVWPTPYWYWLADDGNFFRQNRFNRCVEGYWYELAQWRSTSAESQAQAKIDTEEARKKANSPLPKEK